jgi:CheY-like chemotaxis protein
MQAVAPRVLLVEDQADIATMLMRLLQRNGYEVQWRSTGLEGLRGFLQFKPEIVLLDLGLPELDGFEVARRIRERIDEPQPLIIAISGYGSKADIDRCMAVGMDAHLLKPVPFETLMALLRNAPLPMAATALAG